MKSITLRFFDVNYAVLTTSSSVVSRILGKLSSAASDRMMPVNKNTSDKYDLISNYLNAANKTIIAGTCLRITNSKGVPVIKTEVLSQSQFSISAFNENASDDEKTCLDYFYFCMTDKHLILTVDGRCNNTRFETYINWLLNTVEFGETIDFSPIVDEAKLSLADIQKITIGNSYNIPLKDNPGTDVKSTVVSIAGGVLRSILSDSPNLDELMNSNICSADLVIKFSKPKSMSKEEYIRKTAGAILKPLEDPDGIKFASKGKKVSGTQALRTEVVEVDCDENGVLSEQNIYQTMLKKIRELK